MERKEEKMPGIISQDVFSKMQAGKPFASYKKSILGKVEVKVINPFNGEPERRLLIGNPRTNEDEVIVDVWSEQEDLFFRKFNKRNFDMGYIIPFTRPENPEVEENPNEITDEEIEKLLSTRFFTLQKRVNEFTSVAPVFRMKEKAIELEKSEKIVKFLEGKMMELQALEFGEEIEEE